MGEAQSCISQATSLITSPTLAWSVSGAGRGDGIGLGSPYISVGSHQNVQVVVLRRTLAQPEPGAWNSLPGIMLSAHRESDFLLHLGPQQLVLGLELRDPLMQIQYPMGSNV